MRQITFKKSIIFLSVVLAISVSATFMTSKKVEKVIEASRTYTGVRYQIGGMDRKGIDCSALMLRSFSAVGYTLPRVSWMQATVGKPVPLDKLQLGDLVFFGHLNSTKVSHVGMVTVINSKTDIKFINATCSKGVMESNLYSNYWKSRLLKARRVDLGQDDDNQTSDNNNSDVIVKNETNNTNTNTGNTTVVSNNTSNNNSNSGSNNNSNIKTKFNNVIKGNKNKNNNNSNNGKPEVKKDHKVNLNVNLNIGNNKNNTNNKTKKDDNKSNKITNIIKGNKSNNNSKVKNNNSTKKEKVIKVKDDNKKEKVVKEKDDNKKIKINKNNKVKEDNSNNNYTSNTNNNSSNISDNNKGNTVIKNKTKNTNTTTDDDKTVVYNNNNLKKKESTNKLFDKVEFGPVFFGADNVVKKAKSYMGTPFKKGGMDENGIDVIGLLSQAFSKVDAFLPDNYQDFKTMGVKADLDFVEMGDVLLFVAEPGKKDVIHAGMISEIKGNSLKGYTIKFIHVLPNKGVVETIINDKYWRDRVLGVRRLY